MSMRNIKISICALLLALCAMLTFVLAFGANNGTKAEEAVFEFETTAYAKLEGNGGLRFRLKMNGVAKNAIGDGVITLYAASGKYGAEADDKSEWDALNADHKAWKNEVSKDSIYLGSDGYYYVNYVLDIIGFPEGKAYRMTDFLAFASAGDYTAKSNTSNMLDALSYALLYGFEDKVKAIYPWFEGTAAEDTAINGKYVVTDFDYTSDSDEYILALLGSKYTIQDLKEDAGEFKLEISKDLKLSCTYSDAVKTKLGDDEAAVQAAIDSCKVEKLSDILTTATLTVNDLTVVVYLQKTESGFASRINVKIENVSTDITFNLVYDK